MHDIIIWFDLLAYIFKSNIKVNIENVERISNKKPFPARKIILIMVENYIRWKIQGKS